MRLKPATSPVRAWLLIPVVAPYDISDEQPDVDPKPSVLSELHAG